MMSDEDDEEEQKSGQGSANVVDLEDLGKVMHQAAVCFCAHFQEYGFLGESGFYC